MPRKQRAKPTRANWRSSWKGALQFGLVRFGVEAVNAHSPTGGEIHFHQLHEKCHSRIEYRKFCPIHGEVEQGEIVLGYEYEHGRYVELDPEEFDAVRTREERTLRIEEFIAPDDLDQIYLDGRIYYMTPASAHDREPYQLLRRALEEDDRIGIGQVVFSGKEQLTAVLPRDRILTMAMLNYAPELRDPNDIDAGDDGDVTAKNLRLAKDVVTTMTSRRFSIDAYEDHYRKRVMELIASKRKGHKVVSPPEDEEEEPVINLMEALKKSLPRAAGRANGRAKPAARKAKQRRHAV